MSDLGKKHRVIGIRHVLRQLKKAGLVEENSLYAKQAVTDVQNEVLSRAVTWYRIGARRGALQVLEAFLDGTFRVRTNADGTRDILAKDDKVKWRKKLQVKVGNRKRAVKDTTYSLSTKELEFESQG
jgi:hypothetical protein